MSIKLTACSIVKNEEANIARSINSYKNIVDEIIIVDTGSTDNTVNIAKELGATVLHYEWDNDFSAARNVALDAATGDWILYLDADEWIADNNEADLKESIELAIKNKYDAISGRLINLDDDGSVIETLSILRLFAHKDKIRYRRKIHELIYDFEEDHALASLYIDGLYINHSGYAKSVAKEKVKRNKELLEKMYEEDSADAEALDYFYLARENMIEDPEKADFFLQKLLSNEEYMKKLNEVNISNNLHELKIRLTNILRNKYTFAEREAVIEDAMKEDPDNPAYYYYKYVLYSGIDDEKNKYMLEKALKLDEEYELKARDKNNEFYKYRFETIYELARLELKEGNKVKSLDYVVKLINLGQRDIGTMRLLLSILSAQSTNEIVAFLDSIFNTDELNELKFLVESIRISEHQDVFLYYFVKYYKLTGELDISFATSRLITGNYDEVFSKYLELYKETRQEKALIFAASALIAGNMSQEYSVVKMEFPIEYRKVLSSFFEGEKIDLIDTSKAIFLYIFGEISYILSEDRLNDFVNSFNNVNEVRKLVVDYYFEHYSYGKVISFCNKFIEEELPDDFAGRVIEVVGFSYFISGNFDMATLFFEQAISIGYLSDYVKIPYGKILEAKGLPESDEFKNYSELLYKTNYEKKTNMR
ncbi:MAG: glycosyltransferase family 2 protein [Clostridia bacterium]|nr:glycosyltransferase family 2 protein [Clostridia bacterium]